MFGIFDDKGEIVEAKIFFKRLVADELAADKIVSDRSNFDLFGEPAALMVIEDKIDECFLTDLNAMHS